MVSDAPPSSAFGTFSRQREKEKRHLHVMPRRCVQQKTRQKAGFLWPS
jgi:hypothetical protein